MTNTYRFQRAAVLAGVGVAVIAGVSSRANAQYAKRVLVSDGSVPADHMDPFLMNPWGLVAGPTGPWWVANNHSGTSTLYDGMGVASSLIVNIPGVAGAMGSPTGIVHNSSSTDFVVGGGGGSPTRFMFAGEDGTVAAWAPNNPTQAQIVVDNSGSGAIYKGLALGNSSGGARLFATDFHNGRIDVFDSAFAPVFPSGGFLDPNLPAGYAPFNVMNIGDRLLVTYAQQDANGEDDVPGPGHGFIDAFDFDGNLMSRIASQGALNSPWGMALAPGDFGPFSNALLVGNFGDGVVNAFDPNTGTPLGTLSDDDGHAIQTNGLWGIAFGNGDLAGPTNTLYFTAGIGEEMHGVFGSIAIPAPGAGLALVVCLMGTRRRRA